MIAVTTPSRTAAQLAHDGVEIGAGQEPDERGGEEHALDADVHHAAPLVHRGAQRAVADWHREPEDDRRVGERERHEPPEEVEDGRAAAERQHDDEQAEDDPQDDERPAPDPKARLDGCGRRGHAALGAAAAPLRLGRLPGRNRLSTISAATNRMIAPCTIVMMSIGMSVCALHRALPGAQESEQQRRADNAEWMGPAEQRDGDARRSRR